MQQIQGINSVDQMAMQMQGEMVVPKTDPLENNPTLGVHFMPDSQEGEGNHEVYFI